MRIASSRAWLRLAAAAAVAAGIFAVTSVARAIRLDEPPGRADAVSLGDIQAVGGRPAPRVNISAAVEADPFSPGRQRPLEPYRLPGELVEAPAPSRTQQLKVLGTVVVTNGTSFAMCQLGSDPAVIVRIGGQIGGYTLKRVTRGKATFTSAAGEIEIAAPQPGR